jgi:hypothetical protein
MMNGSRIFAGGIEPGLAHFQDEKIVSVDQAPIGHLAFQVGVAFFNERRRHAGGRRGRETETRELVDLLAGGVASAHHRRRQFQGRNIDHALLALS